MISDRVLYLKKNVMKCFFFKPLAWISLRITSVLSFLNQQYLISTSDFLWYPAVFIVSSSSEHITGVASFQFSNLPSVSFLCPDLLYLPPQNSSSYFTVSSAISLLATNTLII